MLQLSCSLSRESRLHLPVRRVMQNAENNAILGQRPTHPLPKKASAWIDNHKSKLQSVMWKYRGIARYRQDSRDLGLEEGSVNPFTGRPAEKSKISNCTQHFNEEPIPIPDSTQDADLEIEHQLGEFYRQAKNFYPRALGYPGNCEAHQELLGPVMGLSMNNVGDPFHGKIHYVHTKRFEVGVLEWFASLWEIDTEDMWGYITSGGTEANLQGLFMAREKLQDGILYTSTGSHYSIEKAGWILRIPLEKVPVQENGEMDYDDLKQRLKKNAGVPAIINANIGTTMTGAIDNIDRVAQILSECGYLRDQFYIHCDGALAGIMLPFLQTECSPSFKKPINSISVSGHKFLGCPFPCGIFMTRSTVKESLGSSSSYVEYVRTSDTTISGSRSGHAAMYLWYLLAKKGYEGVKKEVMECLRKAQMMKEMLEAVDIECSLNKNSNTVIFPCPSDKLRAKWGLPSLGSKAHVVTMQHVAVDKLHELVIDLVQDLQSQSVV